MKFEYQARTKTGEIQTGIVEAPNEQNALQILHRSNLIVVSVDSVEEESVYLRQFKFLQRVSGKDLAVFSRQLSTLFAAAVPLVSSLHALAEQADNPKLQEALLDIAANVDGGMSFDQAMKQHPNIFSDFYIQIVRAGEESGTLDKVLNYLAKYTEREYRINAKIKGAMIYPAFVLIVFLIIGAVYSAFVVPQLLSVLTQSGAELPFTTKLIVITSDFVRNQWYILLAVLAGGTFFGFKFLKTENGKNLWDRWQLQIPIFGRVFKNIYLFRFAESFGLLMRGGVPLSQALETSANVVGNNVYKDIIMDAREKATRGLSLASALQNHPEISSMVIQMVAVGEQTGKLDEILQNVSEFYEQEVSNAIDNLVALIEPLLIIVMGLAVAVLVAGILLPIYTSINAL